MFKYLIIINIIIFSIGLYYKMQNDKYEEVHGKSHDYISLRYDHPNIYFFLIDRYAKRFINKKKLKPYQKRELINFILYSQENENMRFTRHDLEDDRLLISCFNVERYESLSTKLKKIFTKNKYEEENNMFYDFNEPYNMKDDMNTNINSFSEHNKNYTNEYKKKSKEHNQILSKYCECLTDESFRFDPSIGREKEMEELMITVLTPGKSALLIGKPGVGKTAILEGLAYRIQKGNVPKTLKKYSIYKTSAAFLNSNCMYAGMLEKRVLDLFDALKSQSNVILFIDEIHTLIGTGRSNIGNTLDIANIIKPFITCENINLVGATTDYEYEEFIEGDPAFSRRFSNIIVDEPTDEVLNMIILKTINKYSQIYKIKVNDSLSKNVSTALIKYTKPSYRNSSTSAYNPDLAIGIVAKAFGYARLYDNNQIYREDFIKAYENTDKVIGNIKIDNDNECKKSSKIITVNFRKKYS